LNVGQDTYDFLHNLLIQHLIGTSIHEQSCTGSIADDASPALPSSSPEVNERVFASSTGALAYNVLLPASSCAVGDGTLHVARMDLNGLGSYE